MSCGDEKMIIHAAFNYWLHPPDNLHASLAGFKKPYATDYWPSFWLEHYDKFSKKHFQKGCSSSWKKDLPHFASGAERELNQQVAHRLRETRIGHDRLTLTKSNKSSSRLIDDRPTNRNRAVTKRLRDKHKSRKKYACSKIRFLSNHLGFGLKKSRRHFGVLVTCCAARWRHRPYDL